MSMVDLRPNKNLINPSFESYRLSLDPLPILKQNLSGGVQNVSELSEEQYGYLQVSMSSLLNRLFQDPWAPDSVFYITEARHIVCVRLMQDGRLAEVRVVWQVPFESGHRAANATISFAGAEWALVCDGVGILYLLNTRSRPEGEPWQLCFTHQIDGCTPPCHILCSVYLSYPYSHQVDCLIAHVSRPQDIPENTKLLSSNVHFFCVLEWLTLSTVASEELSGWSVKRYRKLAGCSVPKYFALERSGLSLYLASERKFTFIYDSFKVESSDEEVKEKANVTVVADKCSFTYTQTEEDLTVEVNVPEGTSKHDVKVIFQSSSIDVSIAGKTLLKGTLVGFIDSLTSTWILGKNRIEITLSKCDVGHYWNSLLKSSTQEESFDYTSEQQKRPMLTGEHKDEFEPPLYDARELEECDSLSDFFTFYRYDGDTHKLTHQINLGGHQWLFNMVTSPEALPAFCLRHDVDGLVWQPRNTMSEGEMHDFLVEHVATFPALGYVQASKQDRKFTVGSLNFNFAALCDGVRHLYIYRQPESLNSEIELRNRKTGREVSTIAKQHVISLEQCDCIYGLQANKNCIFILSTHVLYVVKVHH